MGTSSGRVQYGPSSRRPAPSSARGRVCEDEGCSTVLSIYNHLAWCSVHEQPASRRAFGYRPLIELPRH